MSLAPRPRQAMTLIEVMIGTLILALLALALVQILENTSRWDGTEAARDQISEDVTSVWKALNEDLTQAMWWQDTDDTVPSSAITLINDRSLFYLPYLVQPPDEVTALSPAQGLVEHPLLRIFNRHTIADIRASSTVGTLRPVLWLQGGNQESLNDLLPGVAADRQLSPSAATFGAGDGATYRTSYFARSQELVFARTATGTWNSTNNAPSLLASDSPSQVPVPVEVFPTPAGTSGSAAWLSPNNHDRLQVLHPLGYAPGPAGTWIPRVTDALGVAPYGRVMEAAGLDNSSAIDIRPLMETAGVATFEVQDKSEVRLLGYQVVPSPTGLGRLVRTYVVDSPATTPTTGVEPGQAIARDGSRYLVVDRVLSDHVVRVLFETARHTDRIGINNIKATIFFAALRTKAGTKDNLLLIRRSVTMLFTMRGRNTPADQFNARSMIKVSSTLGDGAIPFTY